MGFEISVSLATFSNLSLVPVIQFVAEMLQVY